MKKLTKDDKRDIAIKIVDQMVDLGIIPDDTDTDDENELTLQDAIMEQLKKYKMYKKA